MIIDYMYRVSITTGAVIAGLILLFTAVTAYAESDNDKGKSDDNKKQGLTISSSAQASIQGLQEQIKKLKEQLEQLQKQQGEAMQSFRDSMRNDDDDDDDSNSTTSSASARAELRAQERTDRAALKFLRSLSRGMSGDDVRDLQELLAQDPDIYPASLITGFFGRLTEEAVRKFQKKHGIEQVGIFGPKTTARLLALFVDRVLPPGIIRRLGQVFSSTTPGVGAVTVCHKPAGASPQTIVIAVPALGAHLAHGDTAGVCAGSNTGTTTPDTLAPTLSSITASSVTHQSATVSWTTNEAATGKVYYGTTTPLVLGTAQTLSSASLLVNHSFNLTGLGAATTYYFVVESKDASGNTATSSQQSFATASTPDTTAPVISAISAIPASTTASVSWTTDEAATGKVYYGITNPLDLVTALTMSDATLVTSHVFGLSGLAASTTHNYVLVSTDASGNTATTSQQSFVTTN